MKPGVDGPYCSAFYLPIGVRARINSFGTVSAFLVDARSTMCLAGRHGPMMASAEFQQSFNAACDRDDAATPSRQQVSRAFAEFVGNASFEQLYRRCSKTMRFGHPERTTA
jgi:hypothetical protein